MGMKNSPGLAQITTDRVAQHMYNVLGYIDDYMLFGLDLEDIFKSAESFLVTMSHFNMVVGPSKVNLVSKKRNFLGYSVSQNSIVRITPNKTTDLRDLKTPKSKDELRSVLGLLSWYSQRSLLRDVTRGMREMAKSGVRFSWSQELEKDLREAIRILLDPVTGCLRPARAPSERFPFVVFVDSSRHAFGGVLCQIQEVSDFEIKNENLDKSTSRLYLIEYFSKAIPSNSKLTPIALLELESLFLCLKHWRGFLQNGIKTICFTDSRFVSYWRSIELCSKKVARILMYISEFNLEIQLF